MTIITQHPAMPELLVIPAEPVKTRKTRIKKLFPKFTPNARVEVDPHLIEVREFATWALKQWQAQLDEANVQLRAALGDAEFGTVNGVDVIQRRQEDVLEHHRTATERDYLTGVKG